MGRPAIEASRQIVKSLFSWADQSPDKLAVADVRARLTYAGLRDAIVRAANVLRRSGVQAGDRVVLAAPNSVDQLVSHFAILAAGAVSVPVAGERLAFVVADCTARLAVVDPAIIARFPLPNRDVPVIELSQLRAPTPGRGEIAAEDLLADAAARRLDDLACIMYTTGSTGEPKGVVLSHASLGAALSHIIEYVGFNADDREAVVLPLSHSFGLGQAYCTLMTGGFLWINEGLRPMKTVFDAFRGYDITAMSTTPSMLRLLLGAYRAAFVQNAGKMRRMVVNSEPLPPAQAAEVLAAFPEADVISYYGLTEASRSTFLRLRQEQPARYASVGRAAPRVQIEIRNSENATVTTGAEGEVCIRGPHLAVGYWHRPEEQAAVFRDGWLHTGDLGALDCDGYLTITGRMKDQINVGGLKVSSAEVERVMRTHPGVMDVAVAGMPDPEGLRGEIVAAAVVARDGTLTPDELLSFCASRLETAAQPRRIVLLDRIPRAETGKVLKGELRQYFQRPNAGIPS